MVTKNELVHYIDEYLQYIKYERRLSSNTYSSYKLDLDKYCLHLSDIGITKIDRITKEAIKKYLILLKVYLVM